MTEPHEYKMEECRYYPKCEAPICPLDTNVDKLTWFPSKAICRLKGYKWTSVQRKIARKAKDRFSYYTLADLMKIKRVTSKIEGHNPDKKVRVKGIG